ncbi:MAG: tetratricopeptide repeat protein [Candidatus Acidiferrales bacterium]
MHRFVCLVALPFMVLSFSLPVWAQRGGQGGGVPFDSPAISVQVQNVDGTAATRGIHVVLELEEGGTVEDCQTATGGQCHFTPPGPGVYLVRLKQPGYKDDSKRIELVDIQKGYARLVLKPLDGQTPPPLSGGVGGPAVNVADLSIPENARKEFDKGQKALMDKDLDSGVEHLKKAIQLHDSFPQAYVLLGMAYNGQQKWQDAVVALQRAVQLSPQLGEAYLHLGTSLRQTKDLPGAEKALTKGIELSPNSAALPAGEYELAQTYMDMGQWQSAEPYARKAVAAQPDFALAHWLLAQIMLKKGDGQTAITEFETYLKLDPNGAAAPSVRAVIPKIQAAMAKQQPK